MTKIGMIMLPPGIPSPARWHAQSVWGRLRTVSGRDDFQFVALLANHVVTCQLCHRRWIGGDMPVSYLEDAMATNRRTRDIWAAALVKERDRSA